METPKRNNPYTPSPFLLRKGLPATEVDFFNKYGVTRKKAGEILIAIKKHVQEKNPDIQINHELTWNKAQLEKIFSFAGHNYDQLMININTYEFKYFSPNDCIKQICRDTI